MDVFQWKSHDTLDFLKYRKSNYNDAEKLYNTLDKASSEYGLSIAEPEWVDFEAVDEEEDKPNDEDYCQAQGYIKPELNVHEQGENNN